MPTNQITQINYQNKSKEKLVIELQKLQLDYVSLIAQSQKDRKKNIKLIF